MSCLIVECTWDTTMKEDFQILIILLETRFLSKSAQGSHRPHRTTRSWDRPTLVRESLKLLLVKQHFKGTLTPYIDAVIISHFHLDHCGALPYMSEQVGYEGPIYMTLPTKVIAPILLEDFRKVLICDFYFSPFFNIIFKGCYEA